MRLFILPTLMLVLWGCDTPCESLRSRAQSCGAAPTNFVSEAQATCETLRSEYGSDVFDPFAACVAGSPCSDTDAAARCRDAHLPDPSTSCAELRAWSMACGLEPAGLTNDCDGVRGTLGVFANPELLGLPPDIVDAFGEAGVGVDDLVFDDWVDCVTVDGCPVDDDPRYETCQDEIVPSQATDRLDACLDIVDFSIRCDGLGPVFAPFAPTTLTTCIAQSGPFTSESYVAYGECLSPLACDDFVGWVECQTELQFFDTSNLDGPCTRVLDIGAQCNVLLGGGSRQACGQFLTPFSDESVEEYVTCLEALDCDSAAAGAVQCAVVLELR